MPDLTPAIARTALDADRVQVGMHCLQPQPLVCHYKVADVIASRAFSPTLAASAFMLRGTFLSRAISPRSRTSR